MRLNKKAVFDGVATALITPFCNGKIDYPAFGALIERQIAAGIPALLVAGTTGESATLSYAEHEELIAFARSAVGRRAVLLAGCGSNSTANAVLLAKGAQQAGADALLAVTPYYNKTTQTGVVKHYRKLADAVDLLLMLYNVPSRTGFSMTLDAYRTLADHPNIVGVKEASGDLFLLYRLVSELGDRLDVYTGNDNQTAAAMKLGAKGVVSVYSNLYPERMLALVDACKNGRFDPCNAEAIYAQMDGLFFEVNPIPVKYAAHRMGLCRCEYRLPLCPPSRAVRAKLRKLF